MMISGIIRTAALLLAVQFGVAIQSYAQDTERKSFEMVRTDTPPVIDGIIDEAAWQNAAVVDDFHQVSPLEYDEPSQYTEIRLLYDDDALYIAAKLWDTEPELVVAQRMRQGEQVWGDDFFRIILDPFNDQRSGYIFMLNANGVRSEAIYLDANKQQWNWKGIWRTEGVITEDGWTAELEIPFKTLSFDPENDEWGINFRRQIARANESVGWMSRNRTMNPSVTGVAQGIQDLTQGLGFDIVPSVSAVERKSYSGGLIDSDVDPSLDVFYKFTPGLNGALTINTDFSATEVDDRQVDLSRFSLFFPEKRAFFLQDSDIFEFGRLGGGVFEGPHVSRPSLENGRPFFSRRLGLSRTGQPVDINYGGRLSGRIGEWSVGALAVHQDEFGSIDATDAFVGRVARNVFEESTVGVIVTEGDPRSNLDNSVVGADFRYLNTRLSGGRTLEGEVWYQQSDTHGLDGHDAAWGFRVRAPNNSGFRAGLGLKEIEANFNPALGFVNRTGIRDSTFDLGYTYRPRGGRFQEISTRVDAQRIEFIDGGLQSELITFRALQMQTNTRDRLSMWFNSNKEVITEPFDISDGIFVPVGSYSFDEYRIEFATGNQRPLSGSIGIRGGDFYTGTRKQLTTSLRWAPLRHFVFEAGYNYNDVDLPQGAFEVRLVTLQADVVFSSRLSWVNLIQYDNVTETAGINSRLHWIPQAGREFFIVLNHSLEDFDRDNSFRSQFADFTAKLSYTFRF